ncbi:MAG TPA: DUF1616 domain-containing protein [Methanotrichaceae archaeon]|nr:DUF1616 domain-containing protein [Methanotrichaceae archaeon]
MKQRGPPPWDLTASVLVAASALALSFFSPQPFTSSVEPFLFVLVLLLPGYLLSIALFPRRYDLAGKGRLAVSIGADILLALLLSLGLSLSPWGLHISSLAASAAAISLVLAAIAHFNRSALPRWNRFVPFISGSGRSHPVRKREAGIPRRMIVVLLVLTAAVALSTLAYTTMNAGDMGESGEEENGEAHFTEFYVQGEKDKDHPISISAGSTATTVAGIINHELSAVNYTLRLAQNDSILFQKEVQLDHNQSWEGTVDYVLKDPGSWQRLDFLLYKDDDFTMPYSEDHLWFNVSGANLISENSSETSGDGTTALQQMERVVALGVDEDKSSDNNRNSDSGKATPQVASQSALKPQGKDEPEQFSLQEMESELAETSERNNESLQASYENASRETTTSSSSQNDKGPSEISVHESDVTENDATENDVIESNVIESDIDKSEIPESKERLVATSVASETDDLETDNSKADNSKIGDSSVASEEINSLSGTSEAKEPARDNPESGTSQTDQEAAKPGGDNEKDAPDASPGIGDQSVSQKGEASKTSEMDSEIDSWVSTRGFSGSEQSQAYKSKNIQYVKKGDSGESAVLGSQSKTPVRLGR